MGCDCTNYLPKETRMADIEEFLLLLGFQTGEKGPFSGMTGKPFYWYKDEDYKYITGLYVEVYCEKDDSSQVCVWTRTTIWRSKFDSELHNNTVRQLKKRFGGYFSSDFGRNRYFKYEGAVREKAEAGALRAFSRLDSSLRRARHIIAYANLHDDERYKIQGIHFIDEHNPRIIIANIVVPYLIAAIEEYFRTLYVAIFKYSPNRERIIQAARLQGSDLVAVDRGDFSVIEAVAKWMSFQDMQKVSHSFKELNSKYDIHGILKRPYGRKKLTFWEELNRIIAQRHDLIHRSRMAPDYMPNNLQRDIDMIAKALWRIYQDLITINGWQPVERHEL